ncbi:hypothetical protein V6N11_052559 [Hibiscus sabdariffa]|uniref:Uncharacterized protein n=1 Tax=Hibiscus sabdariffa TaxID=183260 RepID=A0ABR2UAE8_9ROSI
MSIDVKEWLVIGLIILQETLKIGGFCLELFYGTFGVTGIALAQDWVVNFHHINISHNLSADILAKQAYKLECAMHVFLSPACKWSKPDVLKEWRMFQAQYVVE